MPGASCAFMSHCQMTALSVTEIVYQFPFSLESPHLPSWRGLTADVPRKVERGCKQVKISPIIFILVYGLSVMKIVKKLLELMMMEARKAKQNDGKCDRKNEGKLLKCWIFIYFGLRDFNRYTVGRESWFFLSVSANQTCF